MNMECILQRKKCARFTNLFDVPTPENRGWVSARIEILNTAVVIKSRRVGGIKVQIYAIEYHNGRNGLESSVHSAQSVQARKTGVAEDRFHKIQGGRMFCKGIVAGTTNNCYDRPLGISLWKTRQDVWWYVHRDALRNAYTVLVMMHEESIHFCRLRVQETTNSDNSWHLRSHMLWEVV